MVDFTHTLYHMILGAQDATTGQYRRGYTFLSITMIIAPPGTQVNISGHGFYSGRNALGFTNAEVVEGDIVRESSTNIYYQVMGLRPHSWGSNFKFYVVDLREKVDVDVRVPTTGSPVSDPNFFGFESVTPGAVEFEDGFERGYFV